MRSSLRVLLIVGAVIGVAGCDRLFTVTPEQRVGYLRELVRARTVSRDSLPIDACSVNRFMDGVPAWRDSLVDAERTMMVESTPCPDSAAPTPGRFVITGWYRNWSGEYVIRGATYPWDQGYRFTDGIYVGKESFPSQQAYAGMAQPKETATKRAAAAAAPTGDSIRRAGTIADTPATDRSANRPQ
jgi:hypothetical protein